MNINAFINGPINTLAIYSQGVLIETINSTGLNSVESVEIPEQIGVLTVETEVPFQGHGRRRGC